MADGEEDLTLDFGFWAPAPAIQIIKKDKDGRDANTPDKAANLPDGVTKLVFTVNNVGNEDLTNITVSDKVIKGGKVTDLTCRFPDGTRGTTWVGPFTVGDSFTCTATLTRVNSKHKDIATVTGTGTESGTTVTDDDPYHATPGNGVLPDGDGPDNGNLPNTGSPIQPWMTALTGALILGGTLLLLTARRRRKANA